MDTNKVVVIGGATAVSSELTTILQWGLMEAFGSAMPERVALSFVALLAPVLYASLVKLQGLVR